MAVHVEGKRRIRKTVFEGRTNQRMKEEKEEGIRTANPKKRYESDLNLR